MKQSKKKWYEAPITWIIVILMAVSCNTGHRMGYGDAVHDYGTPAEIQAYEQEQAERDAAQDAQNELWIY